MLCGWIMTVVTVTFVTVIVKQVVRYVGGS